MSKEELICSFCARTKSQTQLLIAGLDAHICDKCILQAYGIIEDENKKEENKPKEEKPWYTKEGNATSKEINAMTKKQKAKYIMEGKK